MQAQATVRTAELALKRLIVSGTDDPLWTSSINPVDRPAATPEPINVDAAVARALKERTDLQQSMNNLQISDINLQNQVDQTRPQLNLTFNYGCRARRTIGGTVCDPITGDICAARPVGLPRRAAEHRRVRRAALDARRRLRLPARPERAGSDRRALAPGARPDAGEPEGAAAADRDRRRQRGADRPEQPRERAGLGDRARARAASGSTPPQSKFEVGMSTNYEVVQAQRDFLDAQNNELRALSTTARRS